MDRRAYNAKLAGYSNGGSFWFLNSYGGFWTASAYDKEHAWYVFYYSERKLYYQNLFQQIVWFFRSFA